MTDPAGAVTGPDDTSVPVTGLSAGAVAEWLSLNEADRAALPQIVAAVDDFVSGLDNVDPAGWTPKQQYGALLLAARLYTRRNSPSGVQAFTEVGASYVSRYDPDVSRMLGLDRPTVG